MGSRILILCLLLVGCGTRKIQKTKALTTETRNVQNIVQQDIISTDSTLTYLNIEHFTIFAKDSTQPISIIDSKGNTTTFKNVVSITTKKDRSIVRNAINKSQSNVTTSTVGRTTTIDQEATDKEVDNSIKFDWRFLLFLLLLFIMYNRLK
jgi:hypothetical protein